MTKSISQATPVIVFTFSKYCKLQNQDEYKVKGVNFGHSTRITVQRANDSLSSISTPKRKLPLVRHTEVPQKNRFLCQTGEGTKDVATVATPRKKRKPIGKKKKRHIPLEFYYYFLFFFKFYLILILNYENLSEP